MNNEKIQTSPFLGVSVGSTVIGNTFRPTIIKSNITKMITQKEVEKSMTGKSQYAYSDSLNEGMLGVSGSYGISGILKMTSSLSSYVGNSSASNSKSISVNYNVSMISGIEYINFDDLTAEDIVNSLSLGAKDLALNVLDKFNTVRHHDKQRNFSKKEESMNDWLKDLQKFFNAYGDGLVVGVIWGGVGTVSMNMSSKNYEDNWKYGEKADFSYSSTGASVSVAQSYNGGRTDKASEVTVNCSSWISGGCVEDQVNTWFNVVSNKSFSDIADIKLLDSAPSPSTVSAPPSIPDFVTPLKDDEVKKKLDDIKELGETKEFSICAGFDEAKKTDSQLTLEEFKAKANQKNTLGELDELDEKIKRNQLDVLASRRSTGKTVQLSSRTIEGISSPSDHAVLGVWILNWTDIFPWLSMGYMNEISDTEAAEELLKKRCMIQDLSTLSGIYYTLESCNLNLEPFNLSSAVQAANSFSSALSKLRNTFERDDAIQKVFSELTEEAKAIYTKWNELKFLRNAELGLGLLIGGNKSATPEVDRVNSFPFAEVVYKTGSCSKDYIAFSEKLKTMPFIDTNGDIYVFGPASMMLKAATNDEVTFTKGGLTAMKFTPDLANGTLVNNNIVLIPIPYSAADGIKWFGQGLGKSISSSTSINLQIDNLRAELSKLNICSFSSANWSSDWKYTDAYHLRNLKTSYLGIVEKLDNIFS